MFTFFVVTVIKKLDQGFDSENHPNHVKQKGSI